MVPPESGGFCGHASRLYWLFGRSQFSFYHGISAWQKKGGRSGHSPKKMGLGFWLGFSTLVEMVGCKRGQSQFFVGAFSKGQGLPCLGPIVSSHKLWEKQSCTWHAESRIFISINSSLILFFLKRYQESFEEVPLFSTSEKSFLSPVLTLWLSPCIICVFGKGALLYFEVSWNLSGNKKSMVDKLPASFWTKMAML